MLRLGSIVVVLGVFAGCTERVNVCNSDSECNDPAYPFCDVKGEYAESGMTPMSCSITPASCPIERCGCTPGKVTCEGETRSTCNADGKDVTTETCALGCSVDGVECQIFDPANGLLNPLLASAAAPDVSLPDGSTIDTTTGTVRVNSAPIGIETTMVSQAGGPTILVLKARSWTLGNVKVTGSQPLALVSVGRITLNGKLDASATYQVGGPGSISDSHPCVGGNSRTGGGGGGNLTGGGASTPDVNNNTAAGGAQRGLVPFAGGCASGHVVDQNGTQSGSNGAGGGAVQLASLLEVTLSGSVSLGGGGGSGDTNGGGSGGNLLIEAPVVRVSGGVFANGGSGAACGMPGTNALPSTTAAMGPSCPNGPLGSVSGGRGGTGMTLPGAGSGIGGSAGGGGAAGQMYIATRSGTADLTGSTISAGQKMVTLNPRTP